MAINDSQKLDYLWKKLGYGLSKTDTNANKTATNESIASPLLLRGDNVWSQAQDIPAVKPSSSSGVVTVYSNSAPVECTADITASANRTWKTGTTDWIPVEIGSTYSIQVYVHTSGQASTAVSSGTRLFAAGSGNNDEWFFDYQSGVLHFIGTNLPNGINFTNKSVYIVGARYTGLKGVAAASGGTGDFQNVDAADINVSGVLEVTDRVNILGDLSVTGVSTFTGTIDANGHIDAKTLDVVGLSTFSSELNIGVSTAGITFKSAPNAPSSRLFHDGNNTVLRSVVGNFVVKSDATGNAIVANHGGSVILYYNGATKLETTTTGIDITGLTDTDTLNVSGSSTIGGYVDINSSVDISTDINVGGLSTFVGVGTFGSHLYVGGNLSVDGTTDLDVLNVAELATFSGNIDANGDLDVDGTTDLDTLNVAEHATFSGDINADGNLDVDGQTDLDVLNVAELATFSGNIDANGDLDVDGQTDLDHVAISGVSTFSNTIDANAGVDIAGTLDVAGHTTVNHVTVGGAITATTFTGNLEGNVTGNITGNISGDITGTLQTAAQPNVTSLGTLTSLNVSGDLDVDGATTVDALTVAELATFSGNIDANGNLDVDGTSDLDTVNIAENLNVAGVSTFVGISSFYNNVSIDGDLKASAIVLDNINSTGVATATEFHTGAEGSAIRVTSNTISGPAILTLDPAGVGDNTGKVVIAGDLQVDGTQTIVNSTTVTVNDLHIEVADGAANDAAANGGGIIVQSGEGNKSFTFEATGDNFGSSENLNLAAGKVYKIANTEVLSATQLSITSIVASDVTTSGLLDINAGAQANTLKVEDLTENRIVIAGVGGELEDDSNLTFNGTLLNVGGNINATGNLSADGNLDVDGTTDLDILNVAEIATFSANIDANGNLDVSGTTELDVLNVSQTATFTSNIVANADIDLAGNIDVDGHTDLDNVSVSGVTTFADTVKFGTNIDSNIVPKTDATYDLGSASNEWRDLHLDGIAYLDDVKVTNTLDVVGLTTIRSNTDINGHLDVSGITTLSALRVTGLSTFTGNIDANGDLDVDGHTELDDVNISGLSTFVGVGTFITHLYVGGTLFAPNFSAGGGATIGEDVTARDITATRDLTVNVNLDVDGQTDLDHVAISGVSTFSGNIDANGDLDVDGTTDLDVLNVAELATFSANIDANGALDVAGQTTVNHVTVGGAITATTFTGNLDGTLLTAAQANVTSLGTLTSLTVSGATDLNGALDVDGRSELDDVNVANTLNVVGVSTFAGIGTFGSHLYVAGTFSVDGQSELDALVVSELATFSGNIDANGDLDVDGTTTLDVTTIDGLLDVNAGAQINTLKVEDLTDNRIVIAGSGGELEDDANLTYDGTTLSVGGNLNLSGSIDVTTHTTLQHVTVGGAITATTFTGNLAGNVTGVINTASQPNITSLGTLTSVTVSGGTDLNGDLDVDGHTDLDNVDVSGVSTFASDVNVGGALSVTGNSFFVGMVTFAGGADGNIVLGNASTDNVVFNADVNSNIIPQVDDNYDLGSEAQQWNDLYLDGVAYLDEVKVAETLHVTGLSTFVGISTFENHLYVGGTLFAPNFSAGGGATIGEDVTTRDITASRNLDVDGLSELDDVNVGSALTVAGNIDANGDLDVDGHTNLDNVNVSGIATIGDVIIGGGTTDLMVNGSARVTGFLDIGTASIRFDGTNNKINVGSALTLADNDGIQYHDQSLTQGGLDVNNVNVGTAITVAGPADLNGNLDVSGTSELTHVNVSGTTTATTVSATSVNTTDITVANTASLNQLTVAGFSTFTGVTTFVGDLFVTGNVEVIGELGADLSSGGISTFTDLVIQGDVDIDGQTDLDHVAISGVSTFTGAIVANGLIDANANVDVAGNLDVDGTTELDGLNVDGNTTLDTVTVSQAATLAGASFSGDIDANGNLDVDGTTDLDDTNIVGALTVTGNSTFNGNVDITGVLTYEDVTNVDSVGIATARVGLDVLSGGIDVTGISTFNNNLDVTGALDVDGATTVDALTVAELATFSGNIDANGNLDVDGISDLDDVKVANTLHVTGVSTFVGITTFSNDVFIGGDLRASAIALDNINSTGVATATRFDGEIGKLGNTHYVATTGDDTNAGDNINEPFRTVVKALSVASSGDVVIVAAGEFEETCPMTVPAGVTVKGAGLRATTIKPTTATNTNNIFLVDNISTLEDFTIKGSFYNSSADTGYAFSFANNITISTRSPYIQRVTVLNRGSVTSASDPYGFDTADSAPSSYQAGRGALVDGSKVTSNSLEAGMLFNEVTFFTPNQKGIILTNGARAEYLNCFHYFASQAIVGQVGTTGIGGNAGAKLKLNNPSVTPIVNDVIKLFNGSGVGIATGTVTAYANNYATISGLGIGTFVSSGSSQDVKIYQNDGVTQRGTADNITLADYTMFGAEMRSVGCAVEYGTQGVVADGNGVKLRMFATNFNHVGSGKDFTNDSTLTIQANEVTELNLGQVSFVSIDQHGDFRVGDSLLIDQETGNVAFAATTQNINITGELDVTDGSVTSTLSPTTLTVGSMVIGGNTISSSSGNITIDPSGSNKTIIQGDLGVVGILTANVINVGAFQKGDTSIAITDTGTDGTIVFSTDNTEAFRVNNTQQIVFAGDAVANSHLKVTGVSTFAAVTGTTITATTGFVGNVVGDLEGNADTATTLQTTRTIAGKSFNGSANITIAAQDLSDVDQDLATTDNVQFARVTAPLTGNVTGNVTGNLSGTVLTSAQTNITSLGTLSSVVVSGLADLNGDLDVDGHTDLDNVTVGGAITATTFTGDLDGNATTATTAGTVTTAAQTNITSLGTLSAVTVSGLADLNGDLDVDGHTTLDHVTVGGAITATTFTGDLDGAVLGSTHPNITTIGTLTSLAVGGNADLDGDLDVDGHTNLDNVSISGIVTSTNGFVGALTGNADTATTAGTVTTAAQPNITSVGTLSALTVSGTIDANGNLDVDGTTDLDVLNVAELATFSGNIDANGNLDVDGTTDLDVLNVAETATFSSNIDANGNLDVDGRSELDDVNIANTLNVVGVSTFATILSVENVSSSGVITATTFSGNVVATTISGELTGDVNGNVIGNLNGIVGATTPAAVTGTTITANTGFVGNLTGNVTGTVSDISNHDTDNLSEGSNNLYYTDARADARADLKIAAATGANLSLSNKTTSDLAEGSNLYFTNARADARIAAADTDDLSEGSTNLYFTNARADARADARIAASDTDSLSEGSTNLYFTNTRADGRIALQVGANLDLSSKDTGDLTEGSNLYFTNTRADARVDAGFTAKSTSDLSEGTNLYYTDARADVRVGAATGANLDLSSKSTSDLTEGSNLYFTNTRADARISAASITDLSDADQGVATTDTPTFAGVNVTGITTVTSLKSTALETTYTKNSSATLTTTATTQTSSVQIDASAYRSAEYLIQGTQGTKVHLTKLLAIHDGTTVYLTEYGTVHNGETLATFDVQIVGGQMTLLVTSASTTSTSYNISYTTIKV